MCPQSHLCSPALFEKRREKDGAPAREKYGTRYSQRYFEVRAIPENADLDGAPRRCVPKAIFALPPFSQKARKDGAPASTEQGTASGTLKFELSHPKQSLDGAPRRCVHKAIFALSPFSQKARKDGAPASKEQGTANGTLKFRHAIPPKQSGWGTQAMCPQGNLCIFALWSFSQKSCQKRMGHLQGTQAMCQKAIICGSVCFFLSKSQPRRTGSTRNRSEATVFRRKL